METEDLMGLTARIVAAYVSKNQVPISAIGPTVDGVKTALLSLSNKSEPEHEKPQPAVNPKRSVFPDRIISLEDGKPYKTLKRHLALRGLTPNQYREKWGLPANYPIVASDYSAQRSAMAKSLGLGRKPSKPLPKRKRRS